MDTLPISNLPTPPAPASGESAAEAAIPGDAPPDGGFEAALARSLAGSAKGPADAGAARPEAMGEKDVETADAAALTTFTEGALNASESAMALLAALPPQLARAEQVGSGASPGAGIGDGSSRGFASGRAKGTARAIDDRADDRAGNGNATIAGRRPDDVATTGKGIAPPRPGDTGPLVAADLEKKNGDALPGSLQSMADWNAASPQQTMHAAAHAAYSPTAPATVDSATTAPVLGTPPRIETPLGAPGWSTALADQLVVFAHEKRQVAELRINPPHLGPVDITLSVSGDQASAVFASPHAIVRETIESALPRLREVLAESGINLGQASVTADSPRDGSAQAQSRSSFHGGGQRSGADATHVPAASRTGAGQRLIGLVDLFA